MEITVEILLALFLVATAAGFIDAMAGGEGSLRSLRFWLRG
ncbi:putative membrane protein YfcA [Vibrio sp. JCM 18904]|nr:putative membrane protein YfcA [Vibrio sp. JCM 18904]